MFLIQSLGFTPFHFNPLTFICFHCIPSIHSTLDNIKPIANLDNIDGITKLKTYLSIEHLPWNYMEILDLHSNMLQGPLPVPSLYTYFFSVSRNNLTREIPSLICNLSSLQYLDLSFNHLNNMIPVWDT